MNNLPVNLSNNDVSPAARERVDMFSQELAILLPRAVADAERIQQTNFNTNQLSPENE